MPANKEKVMDMNTQFPKSATRFLILLLVTGLVTLTGITAVPAAGGYEQELAQVPHAVSVSAVSVQAEPADSKELETFIDGIMADQMKTNHIPGAVVSVVKDGKSILEKGYGYSDYENTIPVDPQRTLFRVGSASKLFVWTAVMQLVEQGKLSLDADVNTYLDFKIPATYPQPITMKNLMALSVGS